MSDAITSNLAQTLMELGSHENTWGDILNDNFERIEAKMTVETEISTTGGTTTLSATEEYANVIDVAGALVSNATVVFSGRKGSWLIVNSTTGAFSLTAKVSGQTGIVIAAGETKLVRCDGTDIRSASPSLSQLTSDLDGNGFYIGFDDVTGIKDDAGNKQLVFGKTASAVNYFKMANAAAAGSPVLSVLGSDTDINLTLTPKGAGLVKASAGIVPTANDGGALGSASLSFADLFLASGGIINWNNGDVLATHSANALAFTGASSGYSFDAAVTASSFAVGASFAALLSTEDQVVAGGARVTVKDLGNSSGQTITPDPGDRPIQKCGNNGAWTLAPGSNVGCYLLTVINASGAAVPTTSGWTKVSGAFDSTITSKFLCHCTVTSDFSVLSILKAV